MEKNFQKTLLDLANGACLLDCYMELANVGDFESKMFSILKAQSKHLVGDDGYVNDANRLYSEVLGQNKKVYKTYEYHGDEPVIACFEGKHFVIVDKDKHVIYDPLGPRDNPYKEITSYRVVEERK